MNESQKRTGAKTNDNFLITKEIESLIYSHRRENKKTVSIPFICGINITFSSEVGICGDVVMKKEECPSAPTRQRYKFSGKRQKKEYTLSDKMAENRLGTLFAL